ncbi:hypothetical protein ABES02_01045 [Neobacillus pocheonensis]|uniref:hypothetical protein n=1 Tax=Neobacillus pocheonensis TaxID=363869 RepID=UPI003D29745D
MLKRVVILVVLSSILCTLLIIRTHTTAPVHTSSTQSSDSIKYTTIEYKISEIKGNQYYGKSDDGTGIQFSANKIVSGDRIEVHDEIICYFEKDNLGKGLVKVEKK